MPLANSMNPGCGCGCGPASCGVTVVVRLADILGRTGTTAQFCPNPGPLRYSLDGGAPVAVTPTNGTSGWGFAISFSALISGTHTLRVYSDPDSCGTSRFDSTVGFASSCPSPSPGATIVVPALYDILTSGGTFSLGFCGQGEPFGWLKTTCYGDYLSPSFAVNVTGGGTICSQTSSVTPGNNLASCQVTVKATSYPVSITVTGSAPACISASASVNYTACGASTVTPSTTPTIVYTKLPIVTTTLNVNNNLVRVAGITVTVSGALNGAGTTNAANGGCGAGQTPVAFLTIATRDLSQTLYTWTMSGPGIKTTTYRSDDPQLDQGLFGPTSCPLGGYAERKP